MAENIGEISSIIASSIATASEPVASPDRVARDLVSSMFPAMSIPAEDEEEEVPSGQQLQAIQRTLSEQTDRITASIQELEAGTKQSEAARATIGAAITSAGEAAETIARTKLTAELEAQNQRIEVSEVLGGREAQIQLLTELVEDSERTSDLLEEKVDKSDDRFTRIPIIDTIINEFRTIQLDTEITAAANKEQHTRNQLAGVAAANESTARTTELTKKTVNEGVIEATLAAQQAQTDIQLSEAQLKTIHANSEQVAKIYGMRQDEISNLIRAFEFEGRAENRELARERNKIAREELDLRRENLPSQRRLNAINLEKAELALADAKDPKAIAAKEAQRDAVIRTGEQIIRDEAILISTVQTGQAAAGVAIEDPALITRGLTSTSVATRTRYNRFLEIGASPNQQLGATPADSLENLTVISPTGNFIPTSNTNILRGISAALEADYIATPTDRPPVTKAGEEQVKKDFNSKAEEIARNASAVIATGDTANPYHGPPMVALVEMRAISGSPEVEALALYSKVLEPMSMNELNPQSIVDAAVNGIVAETITVEQAIAGIETIFEAAAAYNNTIAGGYRRIGFPSQTTYNVLLEREFTTFETLTGAAQVGITTALGPLRTLEFGVTLGHLPGAIETIQASAQRAFAQRFNVVDLMDASEVRLEIVKKLSDTSPTVAVPEEGSARNEEVDREKAKEAAFEKARLEGASLEDAFAAGKEAAAAVGT